jgi:hypothetical protein
MKKNDNGLGELLALLKAHPELMKDLVFEPTKITTLLRGNAARRLVLGVDAKKFLKYVASSKDGYPIAQCLKETRVLCAKGTAQALCGGGTSHPPQ